MKVTKGVILAAGRGTRMKSLTEGVPKPMLPLDGKPMLAHLIEAVGEAGVEDVLLVVGYKADKVRAYFAEHQPKQVQLAYRHQEKQDGTGSAARLGREFVGDNPFLLTFGDILAPAGTYRALFRLMDDGADAVLAVKRVEDPSQGAAVYTEGDRIVRIVEKPPKGTSTTSWINAGIYCFQPRIFDEIDRIPISPRGEYELTDAIHQLLAQGAVLRWHEIKGFWRDVGRPEDLPAAEGFIRHQA